MKALLALGLLLVLLQAQVDTAPTIDASVLRNVVPTAAPTGSANLARASTDTAPNSQVATSIPAASNFRALPITTRLTDYQKANTVWNYLQQLGGGCCNKCNEICGFAIKRLGTNSYLTNRGGWYRFETTSLPSGFRIFTLSQNVDCTWTIIDSNGRYMSANSNYGSPWTALIGNKVTRGINERWYLERHNNHIHIQSASWEKYFITRTSSNLARKTLNAALNLEIEFYPCDKLAWWNY